MSSDSESSNFQINNGRDGGMQERTLAIGSSQEPSGDSQQQMGVDSLLLLQQSGSSHAAVPQSAHYLIPSEFPEHGFTRVRLAVFLIRDVSGRVCADNVDKLSLTVGDEVSSFLFDLPSEKITTNTHAGTGKQHCQVCIKYILPFLYDELNYHAVRYRGKANSLAVFTVPQGILQADCSRGVCAKLTPGNTHTSGHELLSGDRNQCIPLQYEKDQMYLSAVLSFVPSQNKPDSGCTVVKQAMELCDYINTLSDAYANASKCTGPSSSSSSSALPTVTSSDIVKFNKVQVNALTCSSKLKFCQMLKLKMKVQYFFT